MRIVLMGGAKMAVATVSGTAELKMRLWWLELIRGIAILGLGIGLFIWPESTTESLLRFMALYWLSSGVMSLVRAMRGHRRGKALFLVTGMVGILGGLFVLFVPQLTDTVELATLAYMFGIVAILTGLLHIFGGFRTSTGAGRRWSTGSFFLGIVEVVLGLVVILSPGDPSSITFTAATIWALIGGGCLITEAIRLRRLYRVHRHADAS